MELTNLTGQVLDEKYRIDSQLGKGGMGAVYLATHLGTERPVALKVIAPQFMQHEEFVERFKREARAAGRLRHPNVVDVTDFGFSRVGGERVAYLVMEYLDGCTLAEILAEETRLPLGWVVDILEQACSAVDEAHQQGIIHRDLKPDNIWLEPNRRGGYTVKVLDFGIAKLGDTAPPPLHDLSTQTLIDPPLNSLRVGETSAKKSAAPSLEAATQLRPAPDAADATRVADAATQMLPTPSASADARQPSSSLADTRILEEPPAGDVRATGDIGVLKTASYDDGLTRVGSILGTPLYMSPEQCRSAPLDARSDIYSLGVIAYQMLSGKTPFSGDFKEVMRQHLDTPPPPLEQKKISKRVEGVVMSALAKNPSERPSSAEAFASALRAHTEGAGALLRRASALYSEHLPTFLRATVLIYVPFIVVSITQLFFNILNDQKLIPRTASLILSSVFSLLTLFVSFFTASVLIGVMTRLVTQLLAAPLRPLRVRPALYALKDRWRPILWTAMIVNLLIFFSLFLFIVPGLVLMVNYSLLVSVLVMEDIKGRAALRRAKTLARRSRRTVVVIVLFQILAPILTTLLMAFLILSALKWSGSLSGKANLFKNIYQIISLPVLLLISSVSSIITALLYLKTRQAGGEPLKEALGEFEDEELPRRRWQLRMRERLHLTMKTHR